MTGLTFLSWMREGLGASGTQPDHLAGSMPARGTVTVKVRVNQRPEVEVGARLYGPGDVAGIDPRQVLRTDPPAGTDGFEPHLFAQVEFDRPDLPWMFSPAAPASRQRLRPWLVLVVVEAGRATVSAGANGALPRLSCDPGDLPPLDESWSWAHAQVLTDGDLTDDAIDSLLSSAPERTLSRLVCPRRLDDRTAYVAAVVPAFEAGRLAGLGLPVDGDDATELRPAWPPVDGAAGWSLPVYHHWSFVTGERGDFESLVSRLVPRSLPGKVGIRPMDVGSAGSGLPTLPLTAPGRLVDLEGPLRTVGTRPKPWDEATRRSFERAYDRLLDGSTERLSPPSYGDAQAGRRGTPSAGESPAWLRDLNVDPRHRAAAALGAEVVRRHEEDLVAAAWDQAAAVRDANEALRQGQLARELSDSVYRRRVGATASAAHGMSDVHLLHLAAPARYDVGAGRGSAGDRIRANRELDAAVSPAFRRLSRPGGPLARRASRGEAAALATDTVKNLASRKITATPRLTPPPGLLGFEDFSDEETLARLRGDRLTPRWWEEDPQQPQQQPGAYSAPLSRVGAAIAGRVFVVTVDGRLMSRVQSDVHTGWVDHGRPPGASIRSAPVAVRDLHVFLTGQNGALYECGWDGERWAWVSHGNPPGTTIGWAFELASSAWNSRPISGGLAQTGTFDSVWCVGTNGHLFERKKTGSGWAWASHGTPAGTLCQSTPTVLGGWCLSVVDTEGRLREYSNVGAGWRWTDWGRPSGARLTGQAARVGGLMVSMGTDGKLHTGLPMPFGGHLWIVLTTPQPPSAVLGQTPDGSVLVKSTGQTIMTLGWDAKWKDTSGPPPTDPGWGLQSVIGGNDVYGVGQSRLVRLVRGGHPTWQDLGQPVFGGRGRPDETPPAHIRWRPKLGLMSNLVVGHVDNPGGVNTAYVRFGHDVGFDGEVRGGWDLRPALPHKVGDPTQGFAVAVADLDGDSGRPDLVQFWVDRSSGSGNFGRWRIGRNLDAAGNPSSWTEERRMPTPMSTPLGSDHGLSYGHYIENATATLADLDGDGRQELVVVYVSGLPGNRRLFLRIGWRLDPTTGVATGGWSESAEVPWDGRTPATAAPVVGLGVTVADLDGDLRPELVVLIAEQVGSSVRASYRIGWRINARGNVTGGWSSVKQVPGSFGSSVAGAGLAVADISGSAQPDLLVFHIENLQTENVAYYRVGWDVGTSGEPTRWGTATRVHPGGWFGWENQGASIAVADLDNTLLGDKRLMAQRFRSAALGNLTALHRTQETAAEEDLAALPLAPVAAQVRQALDPETTVTARVSARIEGPDLARTSLADPLSQLQAPPVFPQPMSVLLAELGQEHLLPGADAIPLDTVTLLRTNPAFVEAFLVGANDQLSRELLWREFPTDRRATAFREFWDSRGSGDPAGDTADIPPIRDWPKAARLGGVSSATAGNGVVLLVRGEVVRRFPDLGLHARRALAPGPAGGGVRLGAERLEPAFQGNLSPDILFVGFALSVEQARGSTGDAGWFFVFEEQPTAPRFGLDVPPDEARYGEAPVTWRDLSWAAVATSEPGLEAVTHVPVRQPPFGAATRPLAPDPGSASMSWGHNSAHMAHIHLQQPVRVAYHATALLPSGSGDGWRITHVRRRESGSTQTRVRSVAGRHPDGTWWQMTVDEAVAAIAGRERLYVEEPQGDPVDVVVARTAGGRVYLRTRADSDAPNNLLSLPPIPADADA